MRTHIADRLESLTDVRQAYSLIAMRPSHVRFGAPARTFGTRAHGSPHAGPFADKYVRTHVALTLESLTYGIGQCAGLTEN